MPEDKRKMLQALAAKRKADNEAGGRKKPKETTAVGVVTGKKDSVKVVGGGKVHQKSSPVRKGKETAKGKPKKKTVKLDSDSDTSEEEEDVSGESEEEDVGDSENSDDSDGPRRKKLVSKPVAKPPSAKKGKAVLPVSKGKDLKGKGKDLKGKGKKTADSDDSGAENGLEDDDSDLSEDPLDEVNPDNILPSRTRRRTAQPVNYDFSAGDLDEDDDSDED